MSSVSDNEGPGESEIFRPIDPDSKAFRELRKSAERVKRSWEIHERGIKANAYIQTHFAQLSLPYRDPKDASHWVRINGDKTLVLEPGLVADSAGELHRKYPYGAIPRLFLIWLTSEVQLTKSREVELGDNLQQFMHRLGLEGGGGTRRRRVHDQLRRLIAARISIRQNSDSTSESWQDSAQQMQLADSWDLWFSTRDTEGQRPLLASRITVSEPFYQAIQESSVPLSLEVVREIQDNAMQLDIYAWLVNRLYNRRGTSNIPWHLLHAQFGGAYTRLRDFRRDFSKNLMVVKAYYPQARVSETPKGLILNPSSQHIPSRGRRAEKNTAGEMLAQLSREDK